MASIAARRMLRAIANMGISEAKFGHVQGIVCSGKDLPNLGHSTLGLTVPTDDYLGEFETLN
jgi:hypothetical protein